MEKAVDKNLVQELKELIISVCNLDSIDITPEDIKDDAPLVGPDSPLELDSLDVTEIIVALEKKYNVRVGSMNLSRDIIKSVNALAVFVQEQRHNGIEDTNVTEIKNVEIN